MLEGKGIVVPIDGDGGRSIVGFFATRVVRASNSDQAIEKAQSMILEDWSTGPYAAKNQGSLPVLSVENVWPDNFLRAMLFKNGGHAFYPDVEVEDEA